jgi:hypothetical protein
MIAIHPRNPKLALFPFLLLASVWPCFVSSQSYTVSQSGTYNLEFDSPIGFNLEQDAVIQIPIGFNFTFFGQTYTDCYVGGDGFITFGSDPGSYCCGQQLPNPDPANNLIAVAWTNMDYTAGTYEVFGTAPNRRLVITFDLANPCSQAYYGQVKLFESTNVIEIHTQEWNQDQCGASTQGLENADGTTAVLVPGRNFDDTWHVNNGDQDFVSFTPAAPPTASYAVTHGGTYNIEINNPTYIYFNEDDSYEIPIGFNFDFYGQPYSNCWIGSDGFVAFGDYPGGGCCGQAIPDVSPLNNLIAVAWTNMDWHSVHYEVFGDAPNRRLVITFDLRDVCNLTYYGQVKLYESTNIIELHTQEWADGQTPCNSTTQGLENADGTEAVYWTGRNFNTNWTVSPTDQDVVTFTPFNSSDITYVVDQPNDFDLEFQSPNDVTVTADSAVNVPIGFDFSFFGNSYSSCYLDFYGFLSFTPTTNGCCEGQSIPDAAGPNNIIAPGWIGATNDECCYNNEGYNLFSYETIGQAPNRRFIAYFLLPEDCGQYYRGEVKLFESTNIIEIHTDQWAAYNTPCHNATQGIENAAGTSAFFLNGRVASTGWSVISGTNDVVRFSPIPIPAYDAGVSQVSSGPFCSGNQLMTCQISNYGFLPMDSVLVEWEFDGVPQTPVNYHGLIPAGGSNFVVNLDTVNLVFGPTHTLKAWTSLPNGVPDNLPGNDTMQVNVMVGMSGVFTIGGTNPDYNSFQAALADLQTIGICDTAIFNVRPGTYNEHIVIPDISGSIARQVIFQAENGDSSSVVLQYNATSADSNYVVRFNNGHNIVLKNMTINALGTNYATILDLKNSSYSNSIEHCAINGKNVSSTSSAFYCINSASYNFNNRFYQNTISNGSTGFYHHDGPADTNPTTGLAFLENTFLDFSDKGVATSETGAIQIDGNTFQSAKANARAIDIDLDTDTMRISHNKIYMSAGSYGMEITNVDAPYGSASRIFNNMINVPGDNCLAGLSCYASDRMLVYENTIRVATNVSGRYAFFNSAGQQDTVYNNIFANMGGGTAVYELTTWLNDFDYNDLYVTGNLLGFFGNYYPNLSQWIAGTGYEEHSVSVNPFFTSSTDLHVANSFLNGVATPFYSDPFDIDGQSRNVNAPDIGADEFVPVATDAAITKILSPVISCTEEQQIEIVLANLGTDVLDSVTIQWTLNGVAQPDVVYNSNLMPEGDTAHVVIATHTFSNQADSLRIWVSMPNGVADLQQSNDTITTRFRLPLQGVYTIGGTSPDFTTITDAVKALNRYYTCGPVDFKIRNGIYTEQIEVDSIPTASAVNTISFESESMDSSAVTIQFAPASGDHPAVLMLKGTDYVTFSHLGFKALSSNWGDCIELRYNAKHIRVTHCYVEAYDFGGSSGIGIKSLCFNNPKNEYLTIDHNYFFKGQQAVYIYNCGNRVHDIYVENNAFVNQRYTCMDLNFINGLYVRNNVISTNTTNSGYKGIDLSTLEGNMEISGNIMTMDNTGDGMFLNSVNYGPDHGTARVFNNMIKSSGTGGGIRLWNCESVLTAYNSCNMTGNGPAFEAAGGDSLTVKNNILISNTGEAFGSFSVTPHMFSDYNDLLTISGNLGYWNGITYATLTDWQNGTQFDSNSMSITPQFVSATDLHVLADTLDGAAKPIAGIATDIDNNPRNANTPDIGADEIGANDNDAGVFAILPEMPFARGMQPVKAVVRNYGGNTLTSVEVHWKLNNVAQTTFNYSGSIASLQQDTVILGTVDFSLSTPYNFKSWTSQPNSTIDYYNSNDTLTATTRYAAVSDTVTIGGTAPDVPTIAAAVTALSFGGVMDSVHFQLRTGVYHYTLTLPQTLGMNCNTPIIFESETGHAADVTWDNTAINSTTLTLEGADGVQFKNLTIRTVIAAYHAVEFRSGAMCNAFIDCNIDGVTTTSGLTAQAVVYSNSGGCNQNKFIGNTITNGSYNMYWVGDYETTGALVDSNHFQNAYYEGMVMARLDGPVINRNMITTNSAYGYFYGMFISECDSNVAVTANQILMPGRRCTGMLVNFCHGSASQKILIANNYINLGSSSNSYGIQESYCDYTNIYNNTIRITGGNNSGIAYYRQYGTHVDIQNNIFENAATGPAMYFGGSEGPLTCNHNDLLSNGANLVYYAGTYYTDLAVWQATNFDTNSISIDPMYVPEDGFAVTSAELNAVAIPVSGVTTDIEGDLRDTQTPDIGCDEFYLAADDVGMLSINYPKEPFPSGDNTVFIKFINNGQDTLTTMQVDWEVDGHVQPTYMWTGLLPSAGTYDSLDIGVYNFAAYQMHTIKVWVSLPNGVLDGLATNDTLEVDSLYPALNGVYTIGGANPDFSTISIATYHLNTGGAAGPVTFNIRTGTYLETINLNDFPGSDCSRPVIFQSETGDSSSVIINNLGIDDNIVSLNGADGVIFQHLTFQSVNPAFRNVISYDNGANCNRFSNDRIIGYNASSTGYNDAVILSASSLDTANVFENNLIQYGSMGFYLVGNGAAAHTRIENNFLDHNYYHGIYASSESAIRILHNVFQSGGYSSYTGIYLEYCHGDNQIIQNDVQGILGAHMLYLETCYASNGARGKVANNFFSATPSYGINGVVINNSRYYDFIFNNVNVTGTSPSTALYFHTDSSLYIANNVIVNSGAGQAIYGKNQALFNSDYNDIYGAQGFGQWDDAGIANLAAWQAATGKDSHSLSVNPQYMSGSNLHISNILLNGAGYAIPSIVTDFDSNTRNVPPDIGADEFNPAIANDAGVFSYYGPNAPFAQGSQPVKITLKNYGYQLLTTADVRWVVNGIEQPVFHWTGSLASAICDTIIVGNYNFSPHTDHDMIFWSEIPNGVPDSTHVNDTIAVEDKYPALIGTYTVGGVLPDFNLFSELQTALNKGGILGNVNFNVRNGTYAAQFEIQNFPRTSLSHKVTFQSESGDSSQVTIVKNFYQPYNNYTVRFSNAHNIEFKKLTVSSTQGRVIDIADGSSRINIHNNHVIGLEVPYYTGGSQVIYSGTTTEDTLYIQQNRIEHGDIGILLQGSGGNTEKEITISNNTILNPRYRGIDLYYCNHLKVSGNTILCTANSADGIVITASYGTREISSNDIRLMQGGQYGLNLYDVGGSSANPNLIANNYIYMKNFSSASYGITEGYGDYNNFYYNTVRVENPNSYAFYDYSSNQHIHLRNCIFACPGGGPTIYNTWVTAYTSNTMDYCDLYTTGPVLAYYAAEFANLSALQAGNPQNQHSVSAEPLFVNDSPLIFQAMCDAHATPIPAVSLDINGQTRNATTPDIGAVEFTLPAHDIGAKLLVNPHTYCGLSAAEAVTIRIQNYGANAEIGFDVAYSFNGSNWHTENVGGLSVAAGGTADYTFSTTENLSTPATYTFALFAHLGSDLNRGNDTLRNISVEHIPALVSPVSNMIPTNGELGLETTVSLSWAPAPNATRYDIYIWPFAQNQPVDPQVSDITQINTLYYGLSYGQKYNWRVVAQNVCDQSVNGPIQQFSVRKLPDIVIDTVIAPPTAFSGQTIQVEWQTKNFGPGNTQSQIWSDAVYLSTDATLNISFDTYLGAVQNLTALDSNEAYTNTGLFTVPNGFSGNYYVFVYADRWNNLIESQNNNNWERTPATMMINLSPSPDLKVMSVVTPVTTFSGQTIPVSAVIKNIGTGPTMVSSWHDRIYFGSDPLNFGTGQLIANIPHNGILAVDSSYTVSTNIAIPAGIFGQRYVYVVSDFNNEVFENAAESNNVGISDTIEVILTPPPDLFADNLIFPDTIHNNQTTVLNYTVVNQGGSTIPNTSWYDHVYISQAPVFNANFISYAGSVNNYGPMTVGDPAIKVNSFTMPTWASGQYYYYVQLDKGNQVFEYNFESNNTVRSVGTFIVVNPDLRVSGITHPDTATAGHSIPINWLTINDGPGHLYSRYWYTRIYVSNQQTFNANTATLLKTNYEYVPLMKAGDTLHEATNITLPDGISGSWYVHVVADYSNIVYENGQEANNTGTSATPIAVSLPPYPDLVAREIVIPDTLTAGNLFTLNFEAANQGLAPAGATSVDSFFLSFSPTWNPVSNKVLGRVTGVPAFAAHDSSAYNPTLSISSQQPSNVYYLYIKTDALNQVYEYLGESNNIQRSSAFFLKPAPPVDLHMDTLTAATNTPSSGHPLQISWTVRNQSQTSASTAGWQDALYLSVDSILNRDLDLRFFEIESGAGGLTTGATYTKTVSATIPNGLSGNYYLIAVTDDRNVNQDLDSVDNHNTIRINHVATPLNIILSPSPDLTPVLFTAPPTGFSGQPFDISWSIHNGGNATAQNWIDKIYLSTDNIISQGDILLSSIPRTSANLAPGGDLLDTVNVFVNSQTQGNYILILKTDAENGIYEHQGENNNQVSRSISFTAPPPSDLQVNSIQLPDSTFAGSTISVQWNTINTGSNPSNGLLREIVYLSSDQTLDVDDPLFGYTDQSYYIPPGSSIPHTMTAPVSGASNGDYYALVQTDARDNITESNDDNNIGVSQDQMNVSIEQLYLDSLTTDSIYNGREHYFRIEIPQSDIHQNLRITLDGDSLGQYTEMYLKYGSVPTLSDFDVKHLYPFRQDQELLAENLQAGNYYLMVKGQTMNAAGQQVTLLARIIDFELLSINPERASNRGQTSLELLGTQMDTIRKVYLVRDTSYITPPNPGNTSYPKLYVPGSYQGWNPADQTTVLTSPGTNGQYEGYLYFPDDTTYIKFTTGPSWADNYGDNGPNGILDSAGANIQITRSGFYLIKVNFTTKVYSLELTNFDITGSAVGDSALTAMSYDIEGRYWYVQTDLHAGNFQFMANRDAGNTLGDTGADGLLESNGSPLNIPADGNYTIKLYVDHPDYTYSIELSSSKRIEASLITEINSFRAFATFNLDGVPPGMYTVQATRWDGKVAELVNAFEVIEGGEEPDLQVIMDYPGVVGQRNGPIKITIFFQNAGDHDLVNRTFRFEAPWGNEVARTYEDLISGNTFEYLEIPAEGAYGPPGILPPKAGSVVEVFAWTHPHPTFTLTPDND